MKRIVAYTLAGILAVAPVHASEMTGAWSVTENIEITQEAQNAFNKVANELDGFDYELVGILGTQMVAGTNYCVLCRSTQEDQGGNEYAIMYLYENLDGEVEIAGIQKIEMEMPAVSEENDEAPETIQTGEPTLGEKNALSSALDYLDYTAFSYTGLIKQLEYEGYSHEEATYAVDHCGADWNEQAAKSAADYLEYTSFSRSGLISQLEYEGFTTEQAEYGATAVGY